MIDAASWAPQSSRLPPPMSTSRSRWS